MNILYIYCSITAGINFTIKDSINNNTLVDMTVFLDPEDHWKDTLKTLVKDYHITCAYIDYDNCNFAKPVMRQILSLIDNVHEV